MPSKLFSLRGPKARKEAAKGTLPPQPVPAPLATKAADTAAPWENGSVNGTTGEGPKAQVQHGAMAFGEEVADARDPGTGEAIASGRGASEPSSGDLRPVGQDTLWQSLRQTRSDGGKEAPERTNCRASCATDAFPAEEPSQLPTQCQHPWMGPTRSTASFPLTEALSQSTSARIGVRNPGDHDPAGHVQQNCAPATDNIPKAIRGLPRKARKSSSDGEGRDPAGSPTGTPSSKPAQNAATRTPEALCFGSSHWPRRLDYGGSEPARAPPSSSASPLGPGLAERLELTASEARMTSAAATTAAEQQDCEEQEERSSHGGALQTSPASGPALEPSQSPEGGNAAVHQDPGPWSGLRGLVRSLQSPLPSARLAGAQALRGALKDSKEARLEALRLGCVRPLVLLIHTSESDTLEHAVTALLNLALTHATHEAVVAQGAVDPVVDLLQKEQDRIVPQAARENAAALIFVLTSALENVRALVGAAEGAVPGLIRLLSPEASLRGRKDAALALFNLSLTAANRPIIVSHGGVPPLLSLLREYGSGLEEKGAAVICNLVKAPEGMEAVLFAGGVAPLVETVECGTPRAVEDACGALLVLSSVDRGRREILGEGVVPSLGAIAETGTSRAKAKAAALLKILQ